MENEAPKPATFKQRMALYKFTRINNKGVDIDFDTASELLSRAFDGEDITQDVQALVGREPKTHPVKTAPKVDFDSIIQEAYQSAIEASENMPESFPCGFSTVMIRPARGPLVSYLKKHGIGYHNSYKWERGWHVRPNLMTQSLDRKEAWTRAFAEVLRKHFPDARITTTSRLD